MPPKVISGGDNPYDIHDAKLSSSATAHESSSVTAHEISNIRAPVYTLLTMFASQPTNSVENSSKDQNNNNCYKQLYTGN